MKMDFHITVPAVNINSIAEMKYWDEFCMYFKIIMGIYKTVFNLMLDKFGDVKAHSLLECLVCWLVVDWFSANFIGFYDVCNQQKLF